MNSNQTQTQTLVPLIVTCKDCGEDFTVTVEQQKRLMKLFGDNYKSPARCFGCREARKKERG